MFEEKRAGYLQIIVILFILINSSTMAVAAIDNPNISKQSKNVVEKNTSLNNKSSRRIRTDDIKNKTDLSKNMMSLDRKNSNNTYLTDSQINRLYDSLSMFKKENRKTLKNVLDSVITENGKLNKSSLPDQRKKLLDSLKNDNDKAEVKPQMSFNDKDIEPEYIRKSSNEKPEESELTNSPDLKTSYDYELICEDKYYPRNKEFPSGKKESVEYHHLSSTSGVDDFSPTIGVARSKPAANPYSGLLSIGTIAARLGAAKGTSRFSVSEKIHKETCRIEAELNISYTDFSVSDPIPGSINPFHMDCWNDVNDDTMKNTIRGIIDKGDALALIFSVFSEFGIIAEAVSDVIDLIGLISDLKDFLSLYNALHSDDMKQYLEDDRTFTFGFNRLCGKEEIGNFELGIRAGVSTVSTFISTIILGQVESITIRQYDISIPTANGEVGNISIPDQNNNDVWHTQQYKDSEEYPEPDYSDPVVIMDPVSNNDNDPAHIQLRHVSTDDFEYSLREWKYQDGEHDSEDVNYLAIEDGVHHVDWNPEINKEKRVYIEAGDRMVNSSWKKIRFAESPDPNEGSIFDGTKPIVLTQIQTYNSESSLVTRVKDVTSEGFKVRIQNQENSSDVDSYEEVGFIAITPTEPINGGTSLEYDNFESKKVSVSDGWKKIDFRDDYDKPIFIANIQSTNEKDPASLRYRSLDSNSVEIMIEEEKSKDDEIDHAEEKIGYFVFDNRYNLTDNGLDLTDWNYIYTKHTPNLRPKAKIKTDLKGYTKYIKKIPRFKDVEFTSVSAGTSYRADTDGCLVSREWELPDGSIKRGKKINYTFKESGQKYVNLTVVDDDGLHDICRYSLWVKKEMIDFQEDFEKDLSSWSNVTGLWNRVSEEDQFGDSASGEYSMWYGQESTGDYSTGNRTKGKLVSKEFDLTDIGEASIKFSHWFETESTEGEYDRIMVYVNDERVYYRNSSDPNVGSENSFEYEVIDISKFVGQKVRIKFVFDSVDAKKNDYRGWYVDDFSLRVKHKPLVSINCSHPYARVNETIHFSDNSSIEHGEICYWEWGFEDDYTYKGYNASKHTDLTYNYSTPGIHKVRLKVIADNGISNSITRKIRVETPIKIDSDMDFDPSHGVRGGDGTKNNPWIIEDYNIGVEERKYAFYIANTTEHFVVQDCNLSLSRDYGFYLGNVTNGNIKNNTICSKQEYGILISKSENNLILNNTISSDSCVGLEIGRSNDIKVKNNVLEENDFSIKIKESNDNIIKGNTVCKNSYGIQLFSSNKNKILDNWISENEGSGVFLENSIRNTLKRNLIVNHIRGIYLYDMSRNNTLEDNKISSSDAEGVYLDLGCNNNSLINNIISSNLGHGIYCYRTSDNTFYGNRLYKNSNGIFLKYSDKNEIINNKALSNRDNGFKLYRYVGPSMDTKLINNTVSSNGKHGIFLKSECMDNKLFNNSVRKNDKSGIHIGRGCSFNLIDNNTVSNNGEYGISMLSNNNTLINNSVISNRKDGINFRVYCEYNTIRNNVLSKNRNGIRLSDSYNNHIADNKVSFNTKSGIYLQTSENNTIDNNEVTNNEKNGIYLTHEMGHSSDKNRLTNNTVSDNEGDGIHIDSGPVGYSGFKNNVLIENRVCSNNGDGIELHMSPDNELIDNTILSNKGDGIKVNFSSHNTLLINNTVSYNKGNGVHVPTSDNILLFNNTVTDNRYGVYITTKNNTVQGNDISSNSKSGIYLNWSSENKLIENKISANEANGIILLFGSINNTLSQNIISSNNEYGIQIISCNNNIIVNNSIVENRVGLSINTSMNNIIYHNDFIDNTEQARDDGNQYVYNKWFNAALKEGNYWSDYKGEDKDGDGIGDEPYTINEYLKDKYPIMDPYDTYKNKAYEEEEGSDDNGTDDKDDGSDSDESEDKGLAGFTLILLLLVTLFSSMIYKQKEKKSF